MTMTDSHEERQIVQAFYEAERQSALRALLGKEDQRSNLVEGLLRIVDVRDSVRTKIPTEHPSAAQILQLLQALGAPPKAYILSDDPLFDGTTSSLADCLPRLFESEASFLISCLPGKLAYFHNHRTNICCLLKR